MRELAVHELASEIRNNLDVLTGEYELRLREIGDYARICDEDRLEAARSVLQLIATGVEARDRGLFTRFVQSVAVERMAQGFEIESVQRALYALVQILEPRLPNVETANFLWRTVVQAQTALSQVAMARLRAAQGSQQILIDSMPFGIIIVGKDKRIRRANRSALASMGYTSEGQVAGLVCHDTMCPAEANRCPILDLGQRVDRSERVLVARDGSRIPILKSVVPVTFDGEEALLEAFFDVTERREAQEEIRRLVRALQASHDAIAIADVDGPIRFVNSAFEELTGYSHDEATARGTSVLKSDRYPDEFYAEMWRTILAGRVWRGEVSNQRKDGTTYEAQLTISPVRNDAGQIDQFIAIQRDVTQRKRLEQQIRESLERRGRQVQTSTEIAQEITGAPALSELYQRVVTLVKERFGYYHAQLFLLDEDGGRLVTVAGYGEVGRQLLEQGHQIPLGRGVVGRAGARGQSILSPDVGQDPEWLYHPLLPDTQGELASPIRLRDRVLGVLDVQSDQVDALSDDDRLLIEGLCGQIAAAMESTRLRQETEEHLRELERLTRAMSREGWEAFRREVGSVGYLFDRTDVVSAADLWVPEIGLASERHAFVAPGSNGCEVAVAPLLVRGGEFIGVLGVQDDPRAPMSEEDLALVESVSEQVAQALESARLFEETQKRLQRLAMLSDVSQRLAGGPLEAEEIADVIVRQFVEALGAPEASISLLEPETGMMLVIADSQPEGAISPVPETPSVYRLTDYPATLRVMQTLQPLVVHASDQDADAAELAFMREYRRASLAILPLAVKGQAIGVVELESWDQELHFTPEELDLATTLANQAAAVLENARLFDAARQQVKDLTMLSEVSQALAGAPLRAAEVAEVIANQFVVVMGITEASISLLAPDGETMEIVADLFTDEESLQPPYLEERFSLAEYPGTARVMDTLEPLIVQASDVDADPAELAYMREFGTETLAIFPLAVKGQAIGVLELEVRGREGHFSPQELSTMRTLVNQTAVAMENARLFEEAQRRAAGLQALYQTALRLASRLETPDLLQLIVEQAVALLEAETAGLYLYDPQSDELVFSVAVGFFAEFAGQRLKPGEGLAGQVFQEGRSMTVGDYHAWPGRATPYEQEARIGAVLGVPLFGREGMLGVLDIGSEQKHALDEYDVELAELFAAQAATALETVRLFEETEQSAREMEVINEVGRTITSMLELDQILRQVVDIVKGRFGHYFASIALLEDRQLIFRHGSSVGDSGERLSDPRVSVDVQEGTALIAEAARTRNPVLVHDVLTDPRYLALAELPDTRSELVVPIEVKGRVIGILDVQSDHPGAYDQTDVALLQSLASQIGSAIENVRLFEQTQVALAEADALYRASAGLNTSQSYKDVLAALRAHTVLGQADRLVSIDLFDRPWTVRETPEWINVITRWTPQPLEDASQRYAIEDFPSFFEVLRPDAPLVVGDVDNDPRLDENLRTLFAERFQARSVISVPLTVGGRWIGYANAQYGKPTEFPDAEVRRLVTVAGQAAVAIQGLQRLEEIQQTAERSEALYEMSRTLSSQLEEGPLVRTVLEAVYRTFGCEYVSLAMVDESAGTIGARHSFSREGFDSLPEGIGMAQHSLDHPDIMADVYRSGCTEIIGEWDERFNREIWDRFGQDRLLRIFMPIVARDRTFGVIEVGYDRQDKVSVDEEEVQLLAAFMDQTALALQNVRLLEQTRQQLDDLTTIQTAIAQLTAAPTFDDAIDGLLPQVATIAGADVVRMYLLEDEERMVCVGQHSPVDLTGAQVGDSVSLRDYPLTNEVVQTHRPLSLLTDDPRLQDHARQAFDAAGLTANATIPLIGREGVVGVLSLNRRHIRRAFSGREIGLVQTLADQATIALEKSRLMEEIRAALAEVEATHRSYLRQSWQEYLHRRDLLERGAFLYDRSQGEAVPATRGDAVTVRSLWHPEIEDAVANGGQVTAEDIDDEGGRTSLAVPVVLRGQTLGVIGVEAPLGERQWTQEEIALIEAVGEQLAQTLETTRLFEETSRRAEQMSTLNRVGLDLTSGLELELVLQMLYEHCTEVFVTDTFYVAMYDEGTGLIRFPLLTGIDGPLELAPLNIRDEPGLTGYVIQTGQTLHIPDTHAIPEDAPYHALPISDQPNRCYIGVPLTSRGQVMGVLSIQSRTPHAYTGEDVELLTTLATQASIAIENARAYERLVETAEQLREVDRFKTQFLANMSHELRTPLNSIIGFSRVMLKGIDGPLTDLQEADLTSIYNSGQHLLSLINSILDMSKIEAGKMDLSFEEVSLPEVLDATVSVAKALVKDKPIKLKAMVPDDLPTVWADAQRVRQVILNLLSNAVKFTEKGYIVLRAEAVTEADGKRPSVIISVSDTGVGIDPEAQKLLFIPFQQVDGSTTRRAEGTGLGLAISRSFIDLHGGEIWVESEPGKGSTFAFTLPIYKTALQKEREIGFDLDPDRKTVLAIDDDAGVITLLKRYLENDGYQVIGVTESLRAVEMARRLASNLTAITLDVAMPDLDGWQILQALKRDPETQRIPIVLISIVDDVARGAELGAGICLRKPVTRDDVLDALRKVENGSG